MTDRLHELTRDGLRRRLLLSGASIALLFGRPASSRAAPDAESLAWEALRAGGIVLFRHAYAPGGGDPPEFRLGDCTTQRNLGDEGREQARRIGERLRAERVTIGAVWTSQWCRTRETAMLIAGGPVREEPAFNSFFARRDAEAAQSEAARRALAAWNGPGALVVVTHQVNMTALTGLFPQSGEGFVLRLGPAGTTVVGRLAP